MAGRVGLVAGAGGELGAAFAAELVERGARVLLVDERLDDLRAVAADLPGDDRAVVLRCDVASVADVESVADFVRCGGMTVDLVVHATDGELVGADRSAVGVLASIERQLAVAVRGPSLLATHLSSTLAPSADVVLVGRDPSSVDAAAIGHEVVAGTTSGVARLLRDGLLGADVRVLAARCDAGTDAAAAASAVLDATAPRDGSSVSELRVTARG